MDLPTGRTVAQAVRDGFSNDDPRRDLDLTAAPAWPYALSRRIGFSM
jgi:hypothetical protein